VEAAPGTICRMSRDYSHYIEGLRRRMAETERLVLERREKARKLLPVIVAHLTRNYGARRIILWGSLATGGFRLGSDIDLVVEGLPPGSELFRALAEVQDLAEGIRVEIVPWEDAFDSVRAAAELDGEVLHDSR